MRSAAYILGGLLRLGLVALAGHSPFTPIILHLPIPELLFGAVGGVGPYTMEELLARSKPHLDLSTKDVVPL